MRVFTLAANTPISKCITKKGNDYETQPYPFVKDFTSYEHEVNTIQDFYTVLRAASANGHTLLKGILNKALEDESRAGSTDPNTPTQWLCLDNDADAHLGLTPDQWLLALSPDFANVSYIVQYSARDGINCEKGTRYHIFLMLDAGYLPPILKQWLIHLNVTTSFLRDNIKLNATGSALKFPLDISVCQNDKIIYVADPTCNGFPDPWGDERWQLIEKEPTCHINNVLVPAQRNKEIQNDIINEIREESGLGKKNLKTKTFGRIDILTNPDAATITGVKVDRGFVYINLNSGDSWGYYFPENNPKVLYNFKGETPVLLKEVAPEFYQECINTQHARELEQPLVFRDRKADTYFNGLFLPSMNRMHLFPVASKDKMKDFMAQYGMDIPDPIEDWSLEFDPTTNEVFDADKKWINRFEPTTYMMDELSTSPDVAPMCINKVISSICVNKETYDHFINWLAFIYQTRQKAATSWIFHGVPGTGKGILHEKIIQPLFGLKHSPKILTKNLEEQYNAYMEDTLIVVIDEVNLSDNNFSTVDDTLKNIITEDQITIRRMYMNPYQVRNYVSIIMNTNSNCPLRLQENDRRHNIAPAQETPLAITAEEVGMIKDELVMFGAFLRDYDVNKRKAMKPLLSEARTQMIMASQTSIDGFFGALREGDFDFFLQYKLSNPGLSAGLNYMDFEKIIKSWARDMAISNQTKVFVTRDEMSIVYSYLQKHNDVSPTKFSRMCAKHRLDIYPGSKDGTTKRGTHVTFKSTSTDELAELLEEQKKPQNVVPISERLA